MLPRPPVTESAFEPQMTITTSTLSTVTTLTLFKRTTSKKHGTLHALALTLTLILVC